MKLAKSLVLALSAIAIVATTGCNDEVDKALNGTKVEQIKPVEKKIEFYSLIPDPEGKWEFSAGQEKSFKIEAWVPKGNPVVIFEGEGLPEGAEFKTEIKKVSGKDRLIGKFTWKPSKRMFYKEEFGNSVPNVITKELKVALRSSENKDMFVHKTVVLHINYSPGNFEIKTDKEQLVVKEEDTLEYQFKVELDEPVSNKAWVNAESASPGRLPDGLTVDYVGPGLWQIRYTPSIRTVGRSDPWDAACNCRARVYKVHLVAVNSLGRQTRTKNPLIIRVENKVMAPVIEMPDRVVMSHGASFSFVAKDLGGESAPDVFLAAQPEEGAIRIQTPKTIGKDTTVGAAAWVNVPLSMMDKEQKITIRACSSKNPSNSSEQIHSEEIACSDKTIVVVASNKALPDTKGIRIDRSEWPRGITREIEVNAQIEVKIPVQDLDVAKQDPADPLASVEIGFNDNNSDIDGLRYDVSNQIFSFSPKYPYGSSTAKFPLDREYSVSFKSASGYWVTETFKIRIIENKSGPAEAAEAPAATESDSGGIDLQPENN